VTKPQGVGAVKQSSMSQVQPGEASMPDKNALIVEVESREKAARGLVRFRDYTGVGTLRVER
jgi:hypothetical protein